jgi:integrase/recombinase XerD
MNRSEFKSVFSEQMDQYLDYIVASGYKKKSYYYHLRQFDRFCIEHEICQPVFTSQHATET